MKYFSFFDNEEENKIKYELENEQRDVLHGIIVLSINNFVIVNEMFGKSQGEKVLRKVNENLNTTLKGTDLVVKVRGDEFIIMTKLIREIKNIEKLANLLIGAVAEIEVMDSFYLTASVGMAIYPFHGKEYSILKNKAYQAMYRAKANGKNEYRLYNNAITKAMYQEYIFDRQRFMNSYESEEYFSIDIANRYHDICKELFKGSTDPLDAMHTIMELTCLYLGFSRGYMYSSRGFNERESKMFRYANSGYEFGNESEARRLILQDLQARLAENYNSLSLISVNDDIDVEIKLTLEDDGVTQLLYFPIRVEDKLIGACVLENMQDDLIELSEAELKRLEDDMGSIHSYYANMRDRRFSRDNLAKLALFDNIDACIYIVDSQTHRIEFANKKALNLSSGNVNGELFYKVLNNKEELPADCAMLTMSPDDPHATATDYLYNYSTRQWNKVLCSWMDVYENKYKAIWIGIDVNEFVAEEKEIGSDDEIGSRFL